MKTQRNTPGCFQGLLLLVCTASLTTACSFSSRIDSDAAERTRPVSLPSAPRLAQLHFGRQAIFGLCIPPACPTITSKTLAPLPPLAPQTETQRTTAGSALDAGVEIVPPTRRIPAEAPSAFNRFAEPATRTVTVHFRFGEASLGAAEKARLDGAMAAMPDATRIVISGRTDNRGSARANTSLAQARARAVRDYLLSHRPDLAPALKLDAHGACCYLAPNETARGRAFNRRADVMFSREEAASPP
jgi:outer membrane protein OmpA-like peptidoglycan-associated protein